MSEHLKRALEKQSRELAGPSPVEQHIILLKLSELMDNAPDLSYKPNAGASPQRQWIAEIGALISKAGSSRKISFERSKSILGQYWNFSIEQIQGLALDVIEEIKLELELSGRADVGSAYAPGEIYRFFADLKSIVSGAQTEIFLIDPYFDGEAFNNYLAEVGSDIKARVFANKHTQEVKTYIDKHQAQYNSNIEVKKSKKLHDRLIIIDRADCWITGGSVNHAGNKSPAYLIPVGSEIAKDKLEIYEDIWDASQEIA
ncbi:MAG: hypothetical protein OQK98_01810 [Gammaproteobacteria bacterium]|nr:hypothetical protein [Gammaproteobacteria bacterium]